VKKPKTTYELKNDAIVRNCITHIQSLEVDDKEPFQVLITQGKDLRSIVQNSLYYKHLSEIEKNGMGDLHMFLKKKFLHPIYMSGTTALNLNYQINYQALVTVHQAGIDIDFKKMHESLLTIKDATVKQFSEYINKYWVYINSQGCYLTDPETYKGEI